MLVIVAIAASLLWPLPAAAVGAPVLIDDFAGGGMDRSQVALPTSDSTTAPGSFSEAGGRGTFELHGRGNSANAIELSYTPSGPSVDLTGGGSNTQLLLEFDSILRAPEQPGTTSLQLWVDVWDTAERTSRYASVGVGDAFAHNVALPFTGFTDQSLDLTQVTRIEVTYAYPQSHDHDRDTTAVIDRVWATPPGGIAPAPPAPTITSLSGTSAAGPSDTAIDFEVRFTSGGQPAPVTHTPATADGLRAEHVELSGSAGGEVVAVTGGPDTYTVTVSDLGGDGTVQITVPAGAVRDAWGQDNSTGTSPVVDFTLQIPPAWDVPETLASEVGTAATHELTVSGIPQPATAATGDLPPGVSFAGDGTPRFAGTPEVGGHGLWPVTLEATNAAGAHSTEVTLVVTDRPRIVPPPPQAVPLGDTVDLTVVATGYPAPSITATGLPDGVTADDDGAGNLNISGTPTDVGTATVTVNATNAHGDDAAPFTLEVQRLPAWDTSSLPAVVVDTPFSVDLTTSDAYPAATSITTSGTLPDGVTVHDLGDGVARVAGEVAWVDRGASTFELHATNAAGTATRELTLVANAASSLVLPSDPEAEVGSDAEVVVHADGYPAPEVTVDGLPDGLTVTTSTTSGRTSATIGGSPAAGTGGTHLIDITADNGQGTADAGSFVLTVAEAPVLPTDHLDARVGEAAELSFEVGGYPVPTVTLDSPLPPGLELSADGSTITIAGTPQIGAGDPWSVTLVADNAYGQDHATVTIDITEPPAFTSAHDTTVATDVALDHEIGFHGWPVPTATVTGDLPAGLSIENAPRSVRIVGTVTDASTAGTYPVEVELTNEHGTTSATLTLTVTAAPQLSDTTLTDVVVGEASDHTFTATGYPVPQLAVLGESPIGITLTDHGDGTATLSGVPAGGTGGAYDLQLTATNTFGSTSRPVTLTVREPASLVSTTELTFASGTSSVRHLATRGFPHPSVAATGLPASLTLVDAGDGSATIVGTPSAADSGEHDVTLTLTGAHGGPTDVAVTVVVTQPPAPPTAPVVPPVTAPGGTVDVHIGPIAGHPTPQLHLVGPLPAGLSFVDNGDGTARITGTPQRGGGGTHHLTVIADNGSGSPTHHEVIVTIDERASVDPPGVPPVVPVGAPVELTFTTVGYPIPTLTLRTATSFVPQGEGTYVLSSAAPASDPLPDGLTFTDHGDGTATITGTVVAGAGGTYPLELVATNVHGTSSEPFVLTVTEATTAGPAGTDATPAGASAATAPTDATLPRTGGDAIQVFGLSVLLLAAGGSLLLRPGRSRTRAGRARGAPTPKRVGAGG